MSTPTKSYPTAGQGEPFFNKLNYDVRALIYEYMELPPLSHNYLGFILCCYQTYRETRRAAAINLRHYTRQLQLEVYERFLKKIRVNENPTMRIPTPTFHHVAIGSTFTNLSEIVLHEVPWMHVSIYKKSHFAHQLFARPFKKVTIIGCDRSDKYAGPHRIKRRSMRQLYCAHLEETVIELCKKMKGEKLWKAKTVEFQWDLREQENLLEPTILRGCKHWFRSCKTWKGVHCYFLHSKDGLVGELGFITHDDDGEWPSFSVVNVATREYWHKLNLNQPLQRGLAGASTPEYREMCRELGLHNHFFF